MSDISTKLNYLNDTRLKIKDSLNKFGADLTENDTFRSYSNVLNDIYDKLPKVSGNGSNFTLENAQNGKLDLFEIEGNTEQNNYRGINIYNVNNTKVNVSPEIEILSNDYVSCTYDNTNNSTTHYSNFMIRKTPQLQISTNYLIVCEIQKVSGTGYLYPFTMHLNSCIDTQHSLYNFSNLSAGQKILIPVTTKSSFDETSSDLRTLVRYDGGQSGSITFRLSLLTDTTITSDIFVYEPYVGGTPSPNPDYPQDIEEVENKQVVNVSGKNKYGITSALPYTYANSLPAVQKNEMIIDSYDLNNIQFHASSNSYLIALLPIYQLKPNTDYIITYTRTNNLISSSSPRRYIYNVDSENNYSLNNQFFQDTGDISYQFTTSATGKIAIAFGFSNNSSGSSSTINNLMIRLSTDDDTFEPYHNQDYEIDLHGKNLFDKNNANILNAYIALGNSKITSSNSDKCLYIPIKSNTTYTISKILSSRFVIGCVDEEPVLNSSVCNPISGNQASNTTYTITSGNNSQYLVVFYYTTSDTLTEQEILDSIQIEENSTATEYEEFYDYKLCKIGDYQDSIKKSTGKNLLPYPYPENIKTMNGVTFTVQNDGSILVNGTATAQANIKLFGLQYQDTQKEFPAKYLYGGTNSVRLRALNNTNESYVVLATDTGNGAEIDMSTHNKGYIELTVPKGTTVNNVLIKPMMLNSLDDTTYEPYGEQWYIKKNIGKVVLGSLIWVQETTANSKRYATTGIQNNVIRPASNGITINMLSNIYIKNNASWSWTTTTGRGIAIQTNGQLIIYDEDYNTSSDLNNFTTMLTNKNANLYYPLAIPTYEKITNETLISQLEAIETETGTNIFEVSNDNDVLPSLNVKRLKELEKLS